MNPSTAEQASRKILILALLFTLSCGGTDRREVPPGNRLEPSSSPVVEPQAISFTMDLHGTNPAPKKLTIANRGDRPLMWSVAPTEKWLSVGRDPAVGATSGVEGPGKTSTPPLIVQVDSTGLRPSIYTAFIKIASNGGNLNVPISFTILGGPARLRVEPESFSFSGVMGRINPPAQVLTIFNDGGRHMAWRASTNAKWLTVSRPEGASGVEGPESKSTPPLDVRVDVTGLSAGSYRGQIEVNMEEHTAKIPVSLTVR
ncbi:MAG: hypothetical protein HYS05_12695 [Acidobacteria bacterium]|nr:hypothetical protein [Acidobacteriota bacterium]